MSTASAHSEMAPSPNVALVIIDDNTGSLEMLSAALNREGLTIFTASDPEEGLEIVANTLKSC